MTGKLRESIQSIDSTLFVFHFYVLGHSFGKGYIQCCLTKDIEVPCLSYQPLSHTQKNVNHPFVSTKISFYCLQYAAHILRAVQTEKQRKPLKQKQILRLCPFLYHSAYMPAVKALSHCFHMLMPSKLVQKHCKINCINITLQNMS